MRQAVFAPSALLWDGACTHLLLEGNDRDVEVQLAALAAAGCAATPLCSILRSARA